MRVLVTGANGMLGREVVAALTESGHTAIPTYRPGVNSAEPSPYPLDVSDSEWVMQLFQSQRPDCVVNCAAFTAVDKASSAECRKELMETNVEGAANIASACCALDIPLCHISSDFVFSGSQGEPYIETDRPAPINPYGLSKYQAELAIDKLTHSYWIVRTAWLFGLGKCFPETILKAARAGKPLRVVNDQTGSPTYTVDLARNLVRVIESAPYGTYHLVNRWHATWYEVACKTLEFAGIEAEIESITTEQWPTPAKRPRYSVLSCEKLEELGLYDMRPWEEALADFVRERLNSLSSEN